MLSYQHGFHAGNMADVHKHALLAWMLNYLTQKEKPLSYMETHAGRGLYDLRSVEAQKTGEAAKGIDIASAWFGADDPYARVLTQIRERHGADAYPGSPLVAATLLRAHDPMTLAELHPQENLALRRTIGRRARVLKQDGAQLALSISPPDPRRGLCLIDPSYEVKTDYMAMAQLITKLHRKWPVGVIALWYPLIEGAPHRPMIDALPEGAFVHEVRFAPARPGHRMTGSGMAVINPPWGLDARCDALSAHFATLAPQTPFP